MLLSGGSCTSIASGSPTVAGGRTTFGAATTATATTTGAAATATTLFTDRVDWPLGLATFAAGGDGHEALAAFDALLDLGCAQVLTATGANALRSAKLLESVEDGLDDVALVGATEALGKAVGHARDLEDGADG